MKANHRRLTACAALACTALTSSTAWAQQRTFHLDRLEIPGAPDDGIAVFRPVTQPRALLFGQLALGYTRVPLRTNLIVPSSAGRVLARSNRGVVDNQLTTYANLGMHLFDRLTVGVALPVTLFQSGNVPDYRGGTSFNTTTPDPNGATAGDLRLDVRGVLLRSKSRGSALGAGAHVFLPTGGSNFGGDGQPGLLLMLNGETKLSHLSLVANVGVHFRAQNSINSPAQDAGLGVGRELRYAVGAFLPLPVSTGRFRLGATLFGQTGLQKSDIIGNTFFRKENSPLEFNLEARVRFGPAKRMWGGLAAGSRILNGYGSPDVRVLGFMGIEVPLFEVRAKAPQQAKVSTADPLLDRDGDGIPDDYDACPDDKEDGIGDPNDGCPTDDRDGDGILDRFDKCPDEPEDFDGIDDHDGCPEHDVDNDGVPDTEDACPREPGKPNADKTRNGCPEFVTRDGSTLRIFQQVNFATGSATILPSSFPLLQEIANILEANPSIRKMSIEGHTDNKGAAAMNKRLSANRAASVLKWLVEHGIAAERLESHGFGMEQPIEDNKTAEGRAKNRRVEFKILEEDTP